MLSVCAFTLVIACCCSGWIEFSCKFNIYQTKHYCPLATTFGGNLSGLGKIHVYKLLFDIVRKEYYYDLVKLKKKYWVTDTPISKIQNIPNKFHFAS